MALRWKFTAHIVLFCVADLLVLTTSARIGAPASQLDDVALALDLQQQQANVLENVAGRHRKLKAAEYVGNNGSPSDRFPLGECEGDCDSSDECAGKLECFQRSGSESVPGCDVRSKDDGQDFCYNPNPNSGGNEGTGGGNPPPRSNILDRIGNNGSPSSVFPLQQCLGDCDRDEDCETGFKCFQRGSSDPGPPGCSGSTDGSTDYCYDPNDDTSDNNGGNDNNVPAGTLGRVGNNGDPSSVFPLQHCHGDCDIDEDCETGLKCFQRGSSDPGPPGCSGSTDESTDYCYDPNDDTSDDNGGNDNNVPAGTLGRVGNNGDPSSVFPLQHCHGDCDIDEDCETGLKCFQRGSSDPGPPGCTGSTEESTDYCYDPNDDESDNNGGNNGDTEELSNKGGNWEPRDAFPLGRCEGDCDGDSDCEGTLVCHHRDRGDNEVPGCVGRPGGQNDYCVRPSDETARPPTDGSFRLKMYWRSGYDWQNIFWEEEWCMQCQDRLGNSQCRSGDDVEISHCDDESTWFELVNRDGTEAQLRIAQTDLCLEMVGEKSYWGRRRNAIEVRDCSSSNDDQYFNARWGDDRFEIRTPEDGCMSQDHHPKDREEIFSEDCERADYQDTKDWFMY